MPHGLLLTNSSISIPQGPQSSLHSLLSSFLVIQIYFISSVKAHRLAVHSLLWMVTLEMRILFRWRSQHSSTYRRHSKGRMSAPLNSIRVQTAWKSMWGTCFLIVYSATDFMFRPPGISQRPVTVFSLLSKLDFPLRPVFHFVSRTWKPICLPLLTKWATLGIHPFSALSHSRVPILLFMFR